MHPDRPSAPRVVLTSTANPRVKTLLGLRKRRTRELAGLTVIEGYDELVLALDTGVRPHALFVCFDLAARRDGLALADRAAQLGAEIIAVNERVFQSMAYRESPDGWLAVVPAPGAALADLSPGAQPLLLVGERVEKPGNLGAMLRTADAVGIDAVIAADPVTDWGNPNLIRASKATVFSVPVASASSAETMRWLADRAIAIVATTPDADVPYTAVDYRGPTAIVVGPEDRGLTGDWLAAARTRARIPMTGRVNSLNVATSAAIIAYEARRQRSN